MELTPFGNSYRQHSFLDWAFEVRAAHHHREIGVKLPQPHAGLQSIHSWKLEIEQSHGQIGEFLDKGQCSLTRFSSEHLDTVP